MNDVLIKYCYILMIHFWFSALMNDIETAFIYSDLEEDIYMECWAGMRNITKDYCIILEKSM